MRRTSLGAAALLWLALAGAARAQDASGSIHGRVLVPESMRSRSDTIVYLVGYSEPPPDRVAEVHQRDLLFSPRLLAVTAGQEVSFPNDEDEKLHNVYTRSPPNRVDLGTYPPGETRKLRLTTPGVVEFYCDIHPAMAATILVVPNRQHTLLASDGSFELDGVLPGSWTLYVYNIGLTKPVKRAVEVAAGETLEVTLELRAD